MSFEGERPSLTAAEVTGRLEQLSRLVVLDPARRLHAKIDLSAPAVTRRLRLQSALRQACLKWGGRGRPETAAPT